MRKGQCCPGVEAPWLGLGQAHSLHYQDVSDSHEWVPGIDDRAAEGNSVTLLSLILSCSGNACAVNALVTRVLAPVLRCPGQWLASGCSGEVSQRTFTLALQAR